MYGEGLGIGQYRGKWGWGEAGQDGARDPLARRG